MVQENVAGILAGVRVLEMGTWLAVPYAAALLGDFGAQVIKIESPGQLEGGRTLGGLEQCDPDRSAFFAGFARNKRSMTLDVRKAKGREVLLSLVNKSDVLIEGFRPGTMEKWGLHWPDLEVVNPQLIMLRISAYGQNGPLSHRPGYDRVAQAFAGLTYLTGQPDRPPTRAGLSVADYGSGIFGALGILLALYERRSSGRGQLIDQALYETLVAMLQDIPSRYCRFGEIRERSGNYFPATAPGDTFPTKDGRWIQISSTGDVMFRRLLAALKREDLIEDPRFVTASGRDEHHEFLNDIIREWTMARASEEVQDALDQAEVACSPVMAINDLMDHPQVRARGNFVELEDPSFGVVPAVSVLPRLSRTPGAIRQPGPRLGEHTTEVLRDVLGLSEGEITALRDEGII